MHMSMREYIHASITKKIKISGNGDIQNHPYNSKMNNNSWEPMIYYKLLGKEKED